MIVILMGVSGCGKTSIGLSLSSKLHWQFEDADKHHSVSNVNKMSRGESLTDEDRWSWLQSLHQILKRWHECGQDGILACSALKRAYRKVLLTGEKTEGISNLEQNCLLVLLHGPVDTLANRLSTREGHFMPASLLESQLSQLEVPDEKENCFYCDITKPIDQIVEHIIDKMKK